MATSQELQKQAEERALWYAWYAANRDVYAAANEGFLDEWLTKNNLPLTVENLDAAKAALLPTGKLAIVDVARPRRQEEAPAAAITPADPNALPEGMPSRKELKAMNGEEWKVALKKFGEANVLRVFRGEQ